MKITILHDSNINEAEIVFKYGYLDDELEELLSYISLFDNRIAGTANGETFFIRLSDVFYFETVDRHLFFYTADRAYETKATLQQLEKKLINTPFSRVSKSVILNLRKENSIQPEKHSKLCAKLTNNEKVIVSRQYLNTIKDKLGV